MVTFDNFPGLAESVRDVTGAIQVTFAPIVNESERLQWEMYTVENQDWLISEEHTEYYRNRRLRRALANSTLEYESQPPQQSSSAYEHPSSEDILDLEVLRYPTSQQPPEVLDQQSVLVPSTQNQRRQHEGHNFRGVVPARIHPAPTREERLTPGMQYAPVWQMSPPPYYRGIVNHDLFSEPSFQRLDEVIQDTRKAIISNLLDDDLVDLLLEDHNVMENAFSSLYPDSDHTHGKKHPPCSVMVQPVWDNLKVTMPSLVGYIIALIPWDSYLYDSFRTLSDESALARYEESDCESEALLNYKFQGGETLQYLGDNEKFPGYENYDYGMKSELDFPIQPIPKRQQTQLLTLGSNASMVTVEAEGSPDHPTDCNLEVYLYPASSLKDLYITNMPSYYALMVFATFLILSVAFFVYDCVVERRRGRVMAVAEKTGRIVTSLFPGQFADQLIAEDKQKEKDAKKKKKKLVIQEAPNRQLKKFMDNKPAKEKGGGMDGSGRLGYGDGAPDSHGESPLFLAQSKPIADLFPDTTVLFAGELSGRP